MELKVVRFDDTYSEKWDKFVLNQSANGTFLQTRRFLNYHRDRFEDTSLMIIKGNDTVVAVIPACTVYDDNIKTLHAHKGSTFGGFVFAKNFYDIEHVEAVVLALEEFIKENNYGQVKLTSASDIFTNCKHDLLSYFLFQKGYSSYEELSCYIDFENYNDDVPSNFSSGRRRDYKYSLKNPLSFRQIYTDEEITLFYNILCENLKKFDASPVHSLEEMLEFKNERLTDETAFYGVFNNDEMIAGSMVFLFGKQVFHTQYLAASQDCLKMFPMNFLDTNLIVTAKEGGFKYFSFGTSTEEHGKVLNKKLAEFKEGFGTTYSVNRTYYKAFN